MVFRYRYVYILTKAVKPWDQTRRSTSDQSVAHTNYPFSWMNMEWYFQLYFKPYITDKSLLLIIWYDHFNRSRNVRFKQCERSYQMWKRLNPVHYVQISAAHKILVLPDAQIASARFLRTPSWLWIQLDLCSEICRICRMQFLVILKINLTKN